jgi:hypothetical protein
MAALYLLEEQNGYSHPRSLLQRLEIAELAHMIMKNKVYEE